MWICSRTIIVGTGTTIAKSVRLPWKSLLMVSTVRFSSRTSTTFDAWL